MRSHLVHHFIFAALLGLSACSTVPKHQRPDSATVVQDSLGGALARADSTSSGSLQSPAERQAYAQAVEAAVGAWQSEVPENARRQPQRLQVNGKTYTLRAEWPKTLFFDTLIVPPAPDKRQLDRVIKRDGVGAPFVARWNYTEERKKQHPFLSEAGYLMPVTVTLSFRGSGAAREAVLRIHESRREETVTINGRKQPLAADFSAVSEFILAQSKDKHIGMSGMGALRNSAKYMDKLGLIALEPPSSTRIPVVFVHGLMSRPLTWHNAYNALATDPEIWQNYQIYFFRYPSGVPVVYSSAKFRQQLGVLHEDLKRIGNHQASHHMVLVGHSMGGLVSKMQVVNSGDKLWVNILGAKPSDLGLSKEEYENFRQYLEFSPNPYIDRVIFVCTPHRGSKLATGIAGSIGRSLVSLPFKILGNTMDLLQGEAPKNSVIKKLLDKGVPSSIDNLSPKSLFVKQSTTLPLKPGLHIHSIIGNHNGRALTDPRCSDGVVPYTSAHIEGAESELVVPSNHGAHEHPEAIAEMRRILLLHLKTVR